MKSSVDMQWQRYKQLELIPDSVPIPSANLIDQIKYFWHTLINRDQPLLYRVQQIEHLNNCWQLELGPSHPQVWQLLDECVNQLLSSWRSLSSSEPEVHQITDQGGRVWWYAYDPLTGQATYLESEEEVQVWLEERLYYNYQ
ncbi:hypothetical protein [Thermocoleostomius sinensis]|uniref:Uncharacterized protein n=1 Tax=Thermocoleostomius sinensis A174 TaxID=2016057 RepID=A0A9E8ZDD3_9CYAN|nr:hypothetical protein [Thermocoleostomius sinensis]WAL60756.1 hypothetical protein OXH18_01795 [Thermocoleostomius sinensis A174]